ncbi:hypothetical protein MJH12_03300, partial [bacterium]|nr:hypothetical protein [bacterium]
TGNISITNLASAGDVILSAISGTITATLEADSLDITANGAISIVETNDVTIKSLVQGNPASNFSINAGGSVTFDDDLAASSTNTLIVNAGTDGTGNLTFNKNITSVSGNITISAGTDINFSETTDITTSGSNVSIISTNG